MMLRILGVLLRMRNLHGITKEKFLYRLNRDHRNFIIGDNPFCSWVNIWLEVDLVQLTQKRYQIHLLESYGGLHSVETSQLTFFLRIHDKTTDSVHMHFQSRDNLLR